MAQYGTTKVCSFSSCTGTMELKLRRLPERTVTAEATLRRKPSHYEVWVCVRCGREEAHILPGGET
jgi:hypothetical protein